MTTAHETRRSTRILATELFEDDSKPDDDSVEPLLPALTQTTRGGTKRNKEKQTHGTMAKTRISRSHEKPSRLQQQPQKPNQSRTKSVFLPLSKWKPPTQFLATQKPIGADTPVRKRYSDGWYDGFVESMADTQSMMTDTTTSTTSCATRKHTKKTTERRPVAAKVLWLDGDAGDLSDEELTVTAAAYQLRYKHARKKRPPTGTKIRKRFHNGQWYEGKVKSQTKRASHIVFDDGDEGEMSDEELVLTATAYYLRHHHFSDDVKTTPTKHATERKGRIGARFDCDNEETPGEKGINDMVATKDARILQQKDSNRDGQLGNDSDGPSPSLTDTTAATTPDLNATNNENNSEQCTRESRGGESADHVENKESADPRKSVIPFSSCHDQVNSCKEESKKGDTEEAILIDTTAVEGPPPNGTDWDQKQKVSRANDVLQPTTSNVSRAAKHAAAWNAKYQQFVLFQQQDGHCDVPCEDKSLSIWVENQRYRVKNLHPNRRNLLDQLGFLWHKGRPLGGSRVSRQASRREKIEDETLKEDCSSQSTGADDHGAESNTRKPPSGNKSAEEETTKLQAFRVYREPRCYRDDAGSARTAQKKSNSHLSETHAASCTTSPAKSLSLSPPDTAAIIASIFPSKKKWMPPVGTKVRTLYDIGWFDGTVLSRSQSNQIVTVGYTDGEEDDLSEDEAIVAYAAYQLHHFGKKTPLPAVGTAIRTCVDGTGEWRNGVICHVEGVGENIEALVVYPDNSTEFILDSEELEAAKIAYHVYIMGTLPNLPYPESHVPESHVRSNDATQVRGVNSATQESRDKTKIGTHANEAADDGCLHNDRCDHVSPDMSIGSLCSEKDGEQNAEPTSRIFSCVQSRDRSFSFKPAFVGAQECTPGAEPTCCLASSLVSPSSNGLEICFRFLSIGNEDGHADSAIGPNGRSERAEGGPDAVTPGASTDSMVLSWLTDAVKLKLRDEVRPIRRSQQQRDPLPSTASSSVAAAAASASDGNDKDHVSGILGSGMSHIPVTDESSSSSLAGVGARADSRLPLAITTGKKTRNDKRKTISIVSIDLLKDMFGLLQHPQLSTVEIAEKLGVSRHTVYNYNRDFIKKLKANWNPNEDRFFHDKLATAEERGLEHANVVPSVLLPRGPPPIEVGGKNIGQKRAPSNRQQNLCPSGKRKKTMITPPMNKEEGAENIVNSLLSKTMTTPPAKSAPPLAPPSSSSGPKGSWRELCQHLAHLDDRGSDIDSWYCI